MHPLLQIKNLSVDFINNDQVTPALQHISFDVHKNEIVALVGESGSGKSVTSLSVLRLLPSPPALYSQGAILFSDDGKHSLDLLTAPAAALQKIRGNKIAMIFQEPMSSLNPVMRCGDQVMEALQCHYPMTRETARSQALEWFEKVKLPSPALIMERYPHQLSGGQKQRVMIAMAMCCEPDLLICDEPTTALDVTVQKNILELIKELQQQTGMGVIFITHDLGVVAAIADRTIVLYKGKVVEQNTMRDLFLHPAHAYTKGLLACRPVLYQKGQRLPVVSDFIEGKPPATVVHDSARIATGISKEIILRAESLSVWFPSKKTFLGKSIAYTKAVDDVSFEIYKGETIGLVGESGCGKTTLGRTLLQLIPATSGRIFYKEKDLSTFTPKELQYLRKDIQIIFQDPYSSLNPRLTVGSAITEPLLVHGIASSAKQRKEQVIHLLEKVNLKAEHYHRYPHEFSGGQRQRIVIARALALNPSFIVCDESVSALDVSVQAQVLNLLNDLRSEYGFTAIFISHDLSVVRYISDRILVMNNGKIVESGLAEAVYKHPQSPYTQRLIASIPKGILTSQD